MGSMAHLQEAYLNQRADRPDSMVPPALDEVGWMLEELRVSLWAQQLKTAYPVSVARVEQALKDL
jgi:ATP-dependent helicase HrpA